MEKTDAESVEDMVEANSREVINPMPADSVLIPQIHQITTPVVNAVSSTPTSVNEQRVRDAAIRGQLHEFFRSLPPDRFPALVALGEHVWVDNRDERFTAGLQVLVDGLEHALNTPHRPAPKRRPATTPRRRQPSQQTTNGDTQGR